MTTRIILALAGTAALSFACSGNSSLGKGLRADTAGATGGATGDNRGSGGAGGAPDCRMIECFRAIECVASCDGPVLSSGCCPCADGTFDRALQCPRDGGAATGGATGDNRGSGGATGDNRGSGGTTGDNRGSGGATGDNRGSGGATGDNRGSGGASGDNRGSGGATGDNRGSGGATGDNRGSGGASATGGAGGAPDCRMIECLRAIECVASCDGPVLSSGCCPCTDGTFDRVTECRPDAGTGVNLSQLNEACPANGVCPTGLTPVHYFGIAGPGGPEFCSCSIRCTTSTNVCPTGSSCQYIADGPGQVCVANR